MDAMFAEDVEDYGGLPPPDGLRRLRCAALGVPVRETLWGMLRFDDGTSSTTPP